MYEKIIHYETWSTLPGAPTFLIKIHMVKLNFIWIDNFVKLSSPGPKPLAPKTLKPKTKNQRA